MSKLLHKIWSMRCKGPSIIFTAGRTVSTAANITPSAVFKLHVNNPFRCWHANAIISVDKIVLHFDDKLSKDEFNTYLYIVINFSSGFDTSFNKWNIGDTNQSLHSWQASKMIVRMTWNEIPNMRIWSWKCSPHTINTHAAAEYTTMIFWMNCTAHTYTSLVWFKCKERQHQHVCVHFGIINFEIFSKATASLEFSIIKTIYLILIMFSLFPSVPTIIFHSPYFSTHSCLKEDWNFKSIMIFYTKKTTNESIQK